MQSEAKGEAAEEGVEKEAPHKANFWPVFLRWG